MHINSIQSYNNYNQSSLKNNNKNRSFKHTAMMDAYNSTPSFKSTASEAAQEITPEAKRLLAQAKARMSKPEHAALNEKIKGIINYLSFNYMFERWSPDERFRRDAREARERHDKYIRDNFGDDYETKLALYLVRRAMCNFFPDGFLEEFSKEEQMNVIYLNYYDEIENKITGEHFRINFDEEDKS